MLKLINADGKPFAIFPIKPPGSEGPRSIERTVDSGRYFAILIEVGSIHIAQYKTSRLTNDLPSGSENEAQVKHWDWVL